MKKGVFLICCIFLCSALSWGQTWNLTSTMTAVLDDKGVLTISTTRGAEAMPDYERITFPVELYPGFVITDDLSSAPWREVRNNILSVVIRDNVTTLGDYVFYKLQRVTSVTIPNTVTSIKKWTFYSCNSLTTLTIPNSVEKIEAGAFAFCGNLNSIQVNAQNVVFSSEDGVLYSKDKTFLHTFPVGKSELNEEFTIPPFVTTIGYEAFCNSKLKSVTIPKSVTAIENYAFYFFHIDSEIIDVTVEWATPLSMPSTSSGAFRNLERGCCAAVDIGILHVPVGTKSLYQSDRFWGYFFSIIKEYTPTNMEHIEAPPLQAYASNGILHISGLQAGNPINIYGISGQLIYSGIAKSETEQIPLNVNGAYIVVAENQTIKIIIK